MSMHSDRREFLKTGAAMIAGFGIGLLGSRRLSAANEMPKRAFGSTGEMLSIFAPGGYHLSYPKERKEAYAMMREAYETGVNFFDNAHLYHKGESEIRMGEGVKEFRKNIFIMSKAMDRTADGYRKQLSESLTRLQTDYIDLYCFHDVRTDEDINTIFGPAGAFEEAQKAKEAGKIRYIGMTGHFNGNILVKGLERWDGFAGMLFPINPMDPHYLSNLKIVVPRLEEKKMGILCMKTASAGNTIKKGIATAGECLRFAWSQPITAAVSGCGNMEHLRENMKTAMSFAPMTKEEQASLLARTAPHKGTEIESYKEKV